MKRVKLENQWTENSEDIIKIKIQDSSPSRNSIFSLQSTPIIHVFITSGGVAPKFCYITTVIAAATLLAAAAPMIPKLSPRQSGTDLTSRQCEIGCRNLAAHGILAAPEDELTNENKWYAVTDC